MKMKLEQRKDEDGKHYPGNPLPHGADIKKIELDFIVNGKKKTEEYLDEEWARARAIELESKGIEYYGYVYYYSPRFVIPVWSHEDEAKLSKDEDEQ